MTSLHPQQRGVYGSFWDSTARGFSCLDSVLAGAVTSHVDTSYVPTSPGPADLRMFHACEEVPDSRFRNGSGRPVDIWPLFPQPGQATDCEPEEQGCEMAPGTMALMAVQRGIAARLDVTVDIDDPVEIWSLTLTNQRPRRRRIVLFTRLNWGLRTYPAYYFDMRAVSQGKYLPSCHALIARMSK